MAPVLLIVLAVALLIAVAAWVNGRWADAVQRLTEAAGRIAEGHWDVRAEPTGPEQTRRLAAALNAMAQRMQDRLIDLQAQRGDLDALVDTLPDPILLADSQARIILINTPAARLLGVTSEQALGKKIVAVATDEPILQLFEAVQRRGAGGTDEPHLQQEIRLHRESGRLTLQGFVTRTASGGVLLLLRDLSALADAMQMKTDFVANASHELRTPVSAIKAAFETLREVHADDPEQAQRCLRIMDEHLRRLEAMLQDLLDLSRVESAELRPQITQVAAAGLFAFVRATVGPMAQEKNVELEFSDGHAVPQLRGDEHLLNLVLKNLVENSVKFTAAGGRVEVALRREGGDVVLSVKDTGVGIGPEHLDRVFERFYQATGARSGSAGRGTGLGLAIVKHAVAAMGGTVGIESAPGKGTTVTCTLPQDSQGA